MNRPNEASARPVRRSRVLVGIAILSVALLVGWTAFFGAAVIRGWGRRTLAPHGDAAAFAMAAAGMIEQKNGGNAALVLLDNGQAVFEHFASKGGPVDRNTIFQAASLSKWITAWGVMKLAEEGRIDLDAPISTYLTRWRLPDGEFDERDVTPRRLLSHTAGLTDGLGYLGFSPGEPVQSLLDSLTQTADAAPGVDGRVRVGARPGQSFRYSGGGYALLQLLIEEVSGESFNDYMKGAVLAPLGMSRSTYVLPDEASNVAEAFGLDGSKVALRRFSAPSAASLFTTAADMTLFLQAHVAGAKGEPPGRGVLRPETLEQMRRPQASQFGREIWGLGTMLYAPNNAGAFVIGHDGGNAPAINTTARIDPATGDGIVVFETGRRLLATEIAGEWVFWRTGNVDFPQIATDAQRGLPVLAGGWLVIVAGSVAVSVLVAGRRPRGPG